MKRKRILKKALTLGLCVATLACAVTGCGKGSSDNDSLVNQATKNSKEYVFRKEHIDLGGDYDCNSISYKGDKLYMSSYGESGYCTVFILNSDGTDLKTVKLPQKDNESYGYITPDGKGNFYAVYNIYDYSDMEGEDVITYEEESSSDTADAEGGEAAGEGTADTANAGGDETSADTANAGGDEASADGADSKKVAGDDSSNDNGAEGEAHDTDPQAPSEDGDAAMGSDYAETDGDQKFLIKYDGAGNELMRVDLLEGRNEEDGDVYIYSTVYDDQYGLIISSEQGVQIFNEESGTFKTIVDMKDPASELHDVSLNLIQGFEGKMFAYFWGDSGMELHTFDPATGKLSEKKEAFKSLSDVAFFGGNGYDLYASMTDGFYGYDLAKDEKTKILDYADSDIGLNYGISSAVAISDNEFVANIPDEEYNYKLTRLVKIPADQVKDRTLITLAGNYIDYNVRSKVYKFNDENPDYKIKIVDYSTLSNGDDYNAGATQFNLDIVSGNVPDIMFFTTESPVDSYINKGLFLDLTTNLKNDPELKDVEFVQNVFDAFKTGDKMYQLIPSFYVMSVATKASYLQGKDYLSLKECKEMIEGKGVEYADAFGLTTRDEILYQGILAGGSKFIDWENKQCNFSGDEFIEFLEFTKKFPEKLPDNAWEDYSDAAYREGKSLFSIAYLNGFRNYKRYVDGTFGEDTKLIGFPSELGSNCSVIIPNSSLCISAKSKYSDVCWQLIRQFYLEDYQDALEYEFPIRKSSYDKMAENSKERPSWTDDDGVKHYEDETYWIGDQEIKIQPLTQSDVDYVKSFIGSLSNAYNANTNVYNIITEEVAPFFAGQKTAKEVADIIQSRVSIYVNENS